MKLLQFAGNVLAAVVAYLCLKYAADGTPPECLLAAFMWYAYCDLIGRIKKSA